MVLCRMGQLASMAGIEQSDFGFVNRPQLSSTQRRGPGEQASEQRNDSTAVSGIKLVCMAKLFRELKKFTPLVWSNNYSWLYAHVQQIRNNLQKASRPLSTTSSSAASAVSRSSRHLQSPQEAILTPAPLQSNPSPSPLDHPEALQLQQSVSPTHSNSNRESGSDKLRSSRSSKSGSAASSVHRSVHSKHSYSYREDFSEGKLSPALSSRSSSMLQYGFERLSVSEDQSSVAALPGL